MRILRIFLCGLILASMNHVHAKTPNILWITSEDNSPDHLGAYGNPYVDTPHIDRLADEGFRYIHCYSNGAVCSASRSGWITGMVSTATGLMHHRSGVQIPDDLQLYPEVLRNAGYFTQNVGKHDYNIRGRKDFGWDINVKQVKDAPPAAKVDWQMLEKNQPFFLVINCYESHESRAMGTDHKHDKDQVIIPPYHPDTDQVRANYAHYYDAIRRMDHEVGDALKRLEASGMSEDTIVVYNSDHGGPLPRGKRFMFNSGTHCPLIVRIPEKFKALWPSETPDTVIDRLVSFSDLPVTWIEIAGANRPKNYHGTPFLSDRLETEPQYTFSFRGRNDHRIENVRAIRDKRYLFIKNYIPYVPRGQYLDYQWKIPIQRIWKSAYDAGQTTPEQSRFFEAEHKLHEELYDTLKDPHCLNNLSESPEYQATLLRLRGALQSAQMSYGDTGLIPESEINQLAARRGTTVYEYARNSSLYPKEKYIAAANRALEQDPKNIAHLISDLDSEYIGERYWAATGLMMLAPDAPKAKEALRSALEDSSHNVRLIAAWALIKHGDKPAATSTIRKMIRGNSYALLEILNAIDWMGEEGKVFHPDLRKLKYTKGRVKIMLDWILQPNQ